MTIIPDDIRHQLNFDPQTIAEGDLVRVTFDRENGIGDPMVQGGIIEIDRDPTVGNELWIEIDEAGDNNQTLDWATGYFEGEFYKVVSRKTPFGGKPVRLGDNAELEAL